MLHYSSSKALKVPQTIPPPPRARPRNDIQASVWELEQNERTLVARLADKDEELTKSEEAVRAAGERAGATETELDRVSTKV